MRMLDVWCEAPAGLERITRDDHVIRRDGVGHDDLACADRPLHGQQARLYVAAATLPRGYRPNADPTSVFQVHLVRTTRICGEQNVLAFASYHQIASLRCRRKVA